MRPVPLPISDSNLVLLEFDDGGFDIFNMGFNFNEFVEPEPIRLRPPAVIQSLPDPNYPRNTSRTDPHLHWDLITSSDQLPPHRYFDNIVRKVVLIVVFSKIPRSHFRFHANSLDYELNFSFDLF